MVKITEAIVVEGKYDKNTLSQIVDSSWNCSVLLQKNAA